VIGILNSGRLSVKTPENYARILKRPRQVQTDFYTVSCELMAKFVLMKSVDSSHNMGSGFTALHGTQTRSSAEKAVHLSVRPSLCLSVKRVHCDKPEERSVQICKPHERSFSLVFREEERLVGGDPFYRKFWVNRPPLERNRRF